VILGQYKPRRNPTAIRLFLCGLGGGLDAMRVPTQDRPMNKGIGIAGIAGRMGRLLAEEVAAANLTLAGGIDRPGATIEGARPYADIAALAAAADVVVDFTHASTAAGHARALAAAGTAWVLGTTGLTAADDAAVAEAARHVPVVYAPNFSTGVNLVLALAERMAAALPAGQYDAEIVEMHHRQKVDAPSGTAIGLGRAVAKGRGVVLEEVAESGRQGHTGARRTGAIGFAALRGGQVVGEHTLLFAGATEHIAITHRAFDRRAFATGAVRAALWTRGRPAGLYSMMDVLGISGVA
jgi:4-hydroxy-tetrahydrodipicolinate reductase